VTAAATPTSGAAAPAGRDTLAGLGTLVRFMLRRDRVKLPAWAGGLALFALYVTVAVPAAYGTEEDLGAVTALFGDPVGRMLTGPGYGLEAPTYARVIAGGYSLYLLLLAALMSILLVTRHTRVEEQTGRAELVRASIVGRHTALTATLLVALLTNVAASAAIALVLVAVGGFPTGGSLLVAGSVAAVGLAFAGVGAVTVQLTRYSRAAAGMAGAILGASFVVRAGGDMAREGGTLMSWLSPLGWAQQAAPYVIDRWWPLALPLLLALLATSAGYVLAGRRDHGASLVGDRPGPPRARPRLGTTWGLALRLQRASIAWWAASLAASGLVFGAYADAMRGALDDMPDVFVELFGVEDLLAGYLGYMAAFMAYLVAVYAVLAVQGLRNEETSGRGEAVLATPVGRLAWLGTHLGVTAAGVVAITAATGAATGVGAALVTGEGSHIVELTLAHLNFVPAVLVVMAAAALLFGALPRAIAAVWVILGYGFVVGTFGAMLDLPQGANALSPFGHPSQMPLEPFAVAPAVILVLVAAIAAALGLGAFRGRDVDAT
jgi:ABC-2 type transport system permease protein